MTLTIIDARLDPQIQARNLYWQGWKIQAISNAIGVKASTIYSWKERRNWDGGSPQQRVAVSIEARLIQLVNLPTKTDGVFKEIERLTKTLSTVQDAMSKLADAPQVVGKALPDYTPPTLDKPPREQKEKREKTASNRKASKNLVLNNNQIKQLRTIFNEQAFDYQKRWHEAGLTQRLRNLLKSRQIGATFYFSREAFLRALKTGNNQIFLSASRAQAFQFKQYIADFVAMVDEEFKGDVPVLGNNGARFYFLGTNSRTAQGRNGDLYIDEYFWIDDFKRLSDLAEPMASQKRFRSTYFSTPSFETHPAYSFWTGDAFNDGRPVAERLTLDVGHDALKNGRLDGDGQWRQIVTLDDAEEGGCTLFDKNYLKKRYAPQVYDQLFNCVFAKPGGGVFDYNLLKAAGVDSWDAWSDVFKPWSSPNRPCGNRPVWVGYDPTEDGDAAGLVVVMAPMNRNEPFRIVETRLLYGNDFEMQADVINDLMVIYNVEKVVIDCTGLGAAVFQLVQAFFPNVIGHKYSQELKAQWVHKAQALFRAGRIEWDAGTVAMDMQAAFLTVRLQKTSSGKSVTFSSGRNAVASHGDLAWAAMMAFAEEPMDVIYDDTNSSSFEAY